MRHMLLNASEAAHCLENGQLIAYPTEAVFGLGCDPRNEKAVRTLLSLKQRPASAGLILIGSSFEQFAPWVAQVPTGQLQVAESTWPGPVTWLFPRAPGVPDLVAGNHETIAVRITAHEPSRALCDAFGCALISSSSGRRPAMLSVTLMRWAPSPE